MQPENFVREDDVNGKKDIAVQCKTSAVK
ncbi:unnamed protein product [Chondrus crispus]|uniref:Uncharacterized protein n=1 Tax=Chondrus crispus TaxID=2769 RepID=R7QGP1_CHOCR|nr:unnamed protein product [Chondrus crispus]CDF37687.1 unnamed protein product [Chondrus crispus]|eukprot:XP_005717558.1 unnamed protein product [Chondrus crispus]